MMEHDTFSVKSWNGAERYISAVFVESGEFTGCGDNAEDALISAMEKAARESIEARAELGILLGKRGGNKGGRPCGS